MYTKNGKLTVEFYIYVDVVLLSILCSYSALLFYWVEGVEKYELCVYYNILYDRMMMMSKEEKNRKKEKRKFMYSRMKKLYRENVLLFDESRTATETPLM